MAKEPVPGRVKTRLCPPCTPEQAASIAAAAIADTLDAAMGSGADEVIVALDGAPGPWLPEGVRVVPQVDGAFDRRLTAAWAMTFGPGIQIGMDTPQADATTLDAAMATLASTAGAGGTPAGAHGAPADAHGAPAVLGAAVDGGWWLLGLPAADDRVFTDIPMSTAHTGAAQRRRLVDLGYRVVDAPPLVDVDHMTEARSVADTVPGSRFAAAVHTAHAVHTTRAVAAAHPVAAVDPVS